MAVCFYHKGFYKEPLKHVLYHSNLLIHTRVVATRGQRTRGRTLTGAAAHNRAHIHPPFTPAVILE